MKTGICLAIMANLAVLAQAQMTIDSFETRQLIVADRIFGTTNSASIAAPEVLGGERDVRVHHDGGAVGALIGDVGCVFPSAASLSCGLRVMGCLHLIYDGCDGADAVDPSGLNSLDLTGGGACHAFKFRAVSDLGADVAITVYSDATHYSVAWLPIVADPSFNFEVAYAGFSQFVPAGPDGGADFTSIGAIEFELCNGPGGADISIRDIATVTDLRFGAGSVGYWPHHSELWPVDSLPIGAVMYDKAQLLYIMGLPNRGDASTALAQQLIATKLNIARGSDPATPIQSALSEADLLLALYPGTLPFAIAKTDPNRPHMIAVAEKLAAFNNPPPLP